MRSPLIQSPPMETRSPGPLRRLRDWARPLDFALARRFGLANREDRLFFLLIAAVGVVGGLLGAATDLLIGALQTLLWGSSGDLLTVIPKVHRWVVVAAPALGGVLLGILYWRTHRRSQGEGGGEGMAMLIEAVALSGGRIAPRPVLINAVSAIVTVGAGGSLGREGPMIRLGAMISSWL